jgi:hypothetical protein
MNNTNKIISIHGVPRSGTTWLGQIIDSVPNVRCKYQPLFSNTFKDRLSLRSTSSEISRFFDELYAIKDDFLDRTFEKQHGLHATFPIKDINPDTLVMKHVRYHYLVPHLLEMVPQLKIVAIIRNPCGVLNSWRKAPREFRSEDGLFIDEWRFASKRAMFMPEEYFGFHKWLEFTKMFIELNRLYPDKIIIVKYEHLLIQTKDEVKKIFEFLELDYTSQTEDFIRNSKTIHKNDTYSVYKGNKKSGEWKEDLDPKIIEQIYTELRDTEFERFL